MAYGRKISGGKYHKQRKRKFHDKKRQEHQVSIGETKRKNLRTRGGNKKTITLKENKVNLKVDGKIKKVEIKNVIETPQNIFLARRNILMKGSIIETTEGKARITNRPSQEGCINAIAIKNEK